MPQLQADDLKGVSETLLIPLHYRVEESRSGQGQFKDSVAEAFHSAIAYEWDRFPSEAHQRLMIVARTTILDAEVKAFLASHPEGLVVNLGAGLDTRFHRLDNGQVQWLEIDLPAVIAFRRKLDEPSIPRHSLFAGSVLDREWIAEVQRRRSAHVLFIAEGLLPYFTEEQHRTILGYLAGSFPGQELIFQTSAPSVIRGMAEAGQATALAKLRTSGVELHWGLEEGRDVEKLDPRVQFVGEVAMVDAFTGQIPEALLKKMSPDQMRKAGMIVHVRFGPR